MIGPDGREEVGQLPEAVRQVVLGSVASLMAGHRLLLEGSTAARVNAPSLREALRLCETEPFGEQPAAAFCSGVLIDRDLILTAGHCLGQDADQAAQQCRELRVAFSYSYATLEGQLEITPEQVFFCRQVATHAAAEDGDFAIFQLDRGVTAPLAAVAVSQLGPEVGDELSVASNGAGLPVKVERHASVTEVFDTDFIAETDTFGGSSGGPLIDEELALVGIVKQGAVDWEFVDGCQRAVHTTQSSEHHQDARPALIALCNADWPSEKLCGLSDACGDGICGSDEHAACDGDCRRPSCGDGLCELAERGYCEADCHRYDAVPVDWPLRPEAFLERQRAEKAKALRASGGCATFSVSPVPSPLGATALLWLAVALRARRLAAKKTPGHCIGKGINTPGVYRGAK